VERDVIPHTGDEHLDRNDMERVSDLVTLSPEAIERDAFSRWLQEDLLGPFHRHIGSRFKVGSFTRQPFTVMY